MSSNYQHYLLEQGFIPLHHCQRFSSLGETFHLVTEELEGFYWFYETASFCINIHDFQVKKDSVITQDLSQLSQFIAFSSYLKSANGESFNPYQPLTSHNSFLVWNQGQVFRFLLHKNCDFYSIGIDFKEKMIEDYLLTNGELNLTDIRHIFQETEPLIKNKLGKIAEAISNYQPNTVGSELFYEVKAKEWLSTIITAYYKQKQSPLQETDNLALETVVAYISDHLSTSLSQELLAQIAMMSKSKLKTTFKQRYHMTMTEYIQRRRMTMAEQLLQTTLLNIKEVALAVGYTSHSRFASLFKKYKGIYPHDVRKVKLSQSKAICQNCINSVCDLSKAKKEMS